ncbi:MAG: 6-carboxytetrahydropterin synthase [Cyclobacteriaceae bacterium]|nr:6-carboxytetrahydropterin synthase [Cyclobacteriaceae bacterium]
MGHIIYKEFHGCFGHRVWNQNLEEKFADSTSCTCRHLHGHNFKTVVYLESNKLVNGMVTDFKHLGAFKKWLDRVMDHKTLMDISDPMIPTMLPKAKIEDAILELKDKLFATPETKKELTELEYELYAGIVFVNFVPTAENISKWIFEAVNTLLPQGVRCTKVEFWETQKAGAVYTNE